jgi:hypothetical protein
MAHYAYIDSNNQVVAVIVGKEETTLIDGLNPEIYYAQGTPYTVKRTSYNTQGGVHTLGGEPYRKNFAGIGYTYDTERDSFIPPKPFASWLLNDQSCLWQPPVPMPSTPGMWTWDEETQTWTD